ncbi:MAG: DUF4065 domain-containing protein [Verrucomicrobiaceae bacterium]|nr:MAG: DUF4065 domain-containing protein [Verrucomicrobiaceae bacterium]
MFSEEKATGLAYSFVHKAKGQLPHVKLMKLMYLAERELLRARGVTMTNDLLKNLDNGPVLSKSYNCMKREGQRNTDPNLGKHWRLYLSPIQNKTITEKHPVIVNRLFMPFQLNVIDRVWDEFNKFSEEDLINYTHDLPEWHNPHGSSKDIDIYEVFAGLGFSGEELEYRAKRYLTLQNHNALFAAA